MTKVANDEASCIDRNGDGVIQTSRDTNGDGQISTDLADGEMIIPTDPADPNQYDECVLFTTPVGTVAPDVSARALAISGGMEGTAGEVWVAIYHERRFYKLDPLNGQVVTQTAQLPFGPYGAIVDRKQQLWAVSPGAARLGLIDTTSGTIVRDDIVPPAGTTCGSYALGVDGNNRIWLPGWTAGSVACRYDHATQAWTSFSFGGVTCNKGVPFGRPRGIAVDETGVVYMSADNSAASGAAQLIRLDAGGTDEHRHDALRPVQHLPCGPGRGRRTEGLVDEGGVRADQHQWHQHARPQLLQPEVRLRRHHQLKPARNPGLFPRRGLVFAVAAKVLQAGLQRFFEVPEGAHL